MVVTYSSDYGRKHVVFGKVVKGMEVVWKIEQLGTADGRPSGSVRISNCGETSDSKTSEMLGSEKGNCENLDTNDLAMRLL